MVDVLVGLVFFAAAVAIVARFELDSLNGDVTALALSFVFGGVGFFSICAGMFS